MVPQFRFPSVIRAVLCVIVTAAMLPATAFAQFDAATVLGTVRDSSGAVVPGATVTLKNAATGIAATSVTDEKGSYQFLNVRIGTYNVRAELQGFSVAEAENFSVTVNARQRVDLTLNIGNVGETVVVTGAAQLLETESSDRGQVIRKEQIVNLPLNGRAYADLALLSPGSPTTWRASRASRSAGRAVAQKEVNEQVESDLRTAELYAFPLLFLLSLLFFRSLVAALLPLLVGALAIVGTFLMLRVASELTSVSIFALNLVTGLGLGLAIDYSLFIVSRYREEIARSGPGPEAMRRTLATAGRTVLFSSLTVAGALASLVVFPQRFLYSMGIGGFFVALIAAAIALIVLPAVLDAARRARQLAHARRSSRAAPSATRAPAHEGFWYRLSQLVMRFPGRIAAATAALLIALGLPFLGIKFTSVDAQVLPESASARQVDDVLRTRVPALPRHARSRSPSAAAPAEAARVAAGRGRGARARRTSTRRARCDGGVYAIDVISARRAARRAQPGPGARPARARRRRARRPARPPASSTCRTASSSTCRWCSRSSSWSRSWCCS